MADLPESAAAAGQMWGAADYERIAQEFAPIHDDLVGRLAPKAGERWLDVGTGTGEVALRAARSGAEVTAVDISERLLDQARAKPYAERVDWQLGDAQALDFGDGSFDVVASNFAVIFAPDTERAASELGRVCAAGGRLGVTAWLPNHGLHSLYAQFAPSEGEDPTERWGSREGIRSLLASSFELEVEDRVWNLEADSPEGAWEKLSVGAPPVKALVDSLDPAEAAEFRTAMIDYWKEFSVDGGVREPRGYLLALGRRR